MTFKELSLIDPIIHSLQSEGYLNPTPIQEKAIPEILKKKDILGCAQTGTGKTAAFVLPLLQLLHEEKSGKLEKHPNPNTLILTPTRELAIQIGASIASYGKNLKIKHTVIFGGVSQKSQVDSIQHGTDIIVATPGRLLDLMQQKIINLQSIQQFVLDEADRMLDMGFINDINRIIARIPVKRQTLFFSATMPVEIEKLANSLLKNPSKIVVTPVSSTVDIIQQSVYYLPKHLKQAHLIELLQDQSIKSMLVFTQMKHVANKIAKKLNESGITATAIHGNKSQSARQIALESFKNGKSRILVATDIAARGIDIDELEYVLNFDLPNVPETYVHRIGRTGRAGSKGIAYSFCDPTEIPFLRSIEKLTKRRIQNKN